VLARPDDPWQLRLTSIKPWPSCRHTHPTVAAALELHGQVASRDIARIEIETYRSALELCDNERPTSEYEAKFSLQHCAAAALMDGTLTLGSFDAAARERVAALAARATVAATSEHTNAYPDRWSSRLTLKTVRGQALVAAVPACKGDPEVPVTPDEIKVKAAMLLDHAGLSASESHTLIDAISALTDDGPLPSLDALFH
jgi:2-methylcitrate dehydratase PrpD